MGDSHSEAGARKNPFEVAKSSPSVRVPGFQRPAPGDPLCPKQPGIQLQLDNCSSSLASSSSSKCSVSVKNMIFGKNAASASDVDQQQMEECHIVFGSKTPKSRTGALQKKKTVVSLDEADSSVSSLTSSQASLQSGASARGQALPRPKERVKPRHTSVGVVVTGSYESRRPSRWKRESYHKTCQRWEKKILKNPHVDVSDIPLPPTFNENTLYAKKFIERMAAFKASVLSEMAAQEGSAPGASASTTNEGEGPDFKDGDLKVSL